MRALDPVAEADGLDAAVLVAGPGVHRHRVGVVQQKAPGLATSRMSLQKSSMAAIARWAYIRPPAQSVSPTHWSTPYFSGNVNVGLERFQAALPDHAQHIIGVGDRLPPVVVAVDRRRQPVGLNVPAAKLRHHVHVVRRNVMERKLRVGQLRHGQNIVQQPARKPDRPGPDHRDFQRHFSLLYAGLVPMCCNTCTTTAIVSQVLHGYKS